MAFPVMAVLGAVFKPLVDLIDDLTLSDEEKLTFKQRLFDGQLALYAKVLDFEARMTEAQAKVITAEASSGSWIAQNWRPVLMLTFGGLVVARWFGWTPPGIPNEIEMELWSILKIGIGGYIGGRSVEKVASVVSGAIRDIKAKETP